MAKRCFLFLFPLLILTAAIPFITPSYGGPLPPETELTGAIQKITVYPDRAMIKKEARTALKKGENIVRLSGLSKNLIDESLQVSISAGQGAMLINVSIEETYLNKLSQERVRKLQSMLDSLNEQINAAANELSAINSSVEFLKKTSPFPQNMKASSAEIIEYAKFLEISVAEYLERIATIDNKLKKMKDERAAVEKEIKNLGSQGEMNKTVIVNLRADRDVADTGIALSYIVIGAGWAPQYDIRTDSSSANIDISSVAVIRQSTGEDWKNVPIELSTAKPSVGGTLPEIAPWYIDVYKPGQQYFDLLEKQVMTKSYREEAVMERADESSYVEPEIARETTSVTFVLPGKADILSDNKPYKIPVSSESMKAVIKYNAVPKLSGHVFLNAEIENPFAYPLLSGDMNIYLDGRFVSSSKTNRTIIPGESFQISLGIDEEIQAEWKNLKKYTESAGMFSKTTVMVFEYEISLTNGKSRNVQIDVRDSFPVSRDEKIKVDLKSPSRQEADISDDGIILWNISLARGEKKKLETKFNVQFPKELEVEGLK